jgi:hypothetical protein
VRYFATPYAYDYYLRLTKFYRSFSPRNESIRRADMRIKGSAKLEKNIYVKVISKVSTPWVPHMMFA